MNTGDMLDLLSTMGRPRVSRLKDGAWHASMEFPAPEGVSVEVKSEFNHPTHESALLQLIARVRDMTDMGDKISKSLTTIGGTVVDIRSARL